MEDKTKHYPDGIYFITICEEKGKMVKSMNKPLHILLFKDLGPNRIMYTNFFTKLRVTPS